VIVAAASADPVTLAAVTGAGTLGAFVERQDERPVGEEVVDGGDVWIADCLTRRPHPTHAHLDGVLGWARDLRIGQLYLVHMGNGLDYQTLVAELPDWAAPAYDGLEIELR
jgi:phosphoribosyl 1,2-cyclic phosphodiesterase